MQIRSEAPPTFTSVRRLTRVGLLVNLLFSLGLYNRNILIVTHVRIRIKTSWLGFIVIIDRGLGQRAGAPSVRVAARCPRPWSIIPR